MIRTFLTILFTFAFGTLAYADVQQGIYRGSNRLTMEGCTLEVLTRTDLPNRLAFDVIVTGMLWADALEIAPMKMVDDEGKDYLPVVDYAGFRGELESEAEFVRLALDEKFNPTAFMYFNNLDIADKTKPIVVECHNLKLAPTTSSAN